MVHRRSLARSLILIIVFVGVRCAPAAAQDGRADTWVLENRSYFDPLAAEIHAPDVSAMVLGGSNSFPFVTEPGNRRVWTISLGKEVPVGELKKIAGSKEANDALARMVAHLGENKVDMKAMAHFGPLLTLDPKTERFTGEMADKANPMLTREYRKGYAIKETV